MPIVPVPLNLSARPVLLLDFKLHRYLKSTRNRNDGDFFSILDKEQAIFFFYYLLLNRSSLILIKL